MFRNSLANEQFGIARPDKFNNLKKISINHFIENTLPLIFVYPFLPMLLKKFFTNKIHANKSIPIPHPLLPSPSLSFYLSLIGAGRFPEQPSPSFSFYLSLIGAGRFLEQPSPSLSPKSCPTLIYLSLALILPCIKALPPSIHLQQVPSTFICCVDSL